MASSAPGFVFDREPPHQQRARRALAPAAALAAVGYVTLDRLLTPWLGGVWGVLVSLLLVTAPLGAVWWSGECGVRGWRAWRAGLLLGGMTVLMYAWLFVGSLA
ncbi:MAG: hypothetical protein ABI910_10090 [Gemmatimonadota bacterium]